jgi:hypothetical protein
VDENTVQYAELQARREAMTPEERLRRWEGCEAKGKHYTIIESVPGQGSIAYCINCYVTFSIRGPVDPPRAR